MNQSISGWTALVVLSMVLLSFTSASRFNLHHEGLTRLVISKAEGRVEAEMVPTPEESAREVPTGPDPIHHRHEIPKGHSAQFP